MSRVVHSLLAVSLVIVWCGQPLHAAEGPDIPRRIPPQGIELTDAQRAELQAAVDKFDARLAEVRGAVADPMLVSYLPDAEIYHKAVVYALRHGEFFQKSDVQTALKLLEQGTQRLDALAGNSAPWHHERGLLVRGYRSLVDGSVQPYGLEIPEGVDLEHPAPLYVWLHGRGETTTDLRFIAQRQEKAGQLQPEAAIVLHPFGRYCNAYKFAGEVDVMEAIESVQARYNIDPQRIVLAGFSMGGAGAWHLGAQYADRWAAMHAGAGFIDVQRYQKLNPDDFPWYETTLWKNYDVDGYVRNLFNIPVLAYSGQLDTQKNAGDLMAQAYAAHGQELTHIIGPGMGHKYHPDSLVEIHNFLAKAAAEGNNPYPEHISLQTTTLRYNGYHWLEILGLEEHWRDSRVEADVVGPGELKLATKNITALELTSPWSDAAVFSGALAIEIDGQQLEIDPAQQVREVLYLARDGRTWRAVSRWPTESGLWKISGLQGPIDDVFLTPFLVVTPSRPCANPQVQKWVDAELAHFLRRWSEVFRGDVQIRRDVELTEQETRGYNLILWGDPASNTVLERLMPQLPLEWTAEEIRWQDQRAAADSHVVTMIYPHPQTADRYVVLNSGTTFREGHDRTNSLQIPKLPDWAVLDITEPATAEQAGRVVDAGFFDERWRFKPRP